MGSFELNQAHGDLFQVRQNQVRLIWPQQQNRGALETSSGSAANPVNIRRGILRDVVLDHQANLGNVDTAGHDIGTKQNPGFQAVEFDQIGRSHLTGEVGVQHQQGLVLDVQ